MKFVEAIERAARQTGDHLATVMGERRRTMQQSIDRISRLAGGMRAAGVIQGKTVGILAANSDRYLEIIHACWWIGAIPVPLNSRWALIEHADAINDAEITLLFAGNGFHELAGALREACPGLQTLVALDGGGDFPALETWIATTSRIDADPAPDEACAGIFYTGGATGRSKGVVHSGRSLWAAAQIGAQGLRVPQAPVYLHAAPMFHLGGLMPAFMTTALGGTHMFVDAFRPQAVAQAIREERVTFTALVPVMIGMLVDDESFAAADYASLALVQYGGGAIGSSLREKLARVLPHVRFEQGYGQSEVGGGISTMRHEVMVALTADDIRRHAAGQAHPGIAIVVTDENGAPLPPCAVGEFRVHSPGAMTGYLNRPDETAAALIDGWVRTGDAGYLDEDGFIFMCDRIKDVVRPGGENVFSAEVENALLSYPAITSAAVIAVPDEKWEERVHAIVTIRDDAVLTLEDVQAHCRERIAGYKIPRSLEIIDVMPLSGAGKIVKAQLREPHWRGRDRMRRS